MSVLTFSDVMDSKMKALQWEKLTAEFYAYIGDQNMVSKAQLVRKWHNWKQYNKGASIEFIPTYSLLLRQEKNVLFFHLDIFGYFNIHGFSYNNLLQLSAIERK